MNRHTLTRAVVICLVTLVAAIGGCSSPEDSSVPPGNVGSPMGRDEQDNNSGSDGMMGQPGSGEDNYTSSGERIFLSGVGTEGWDIDRSTSSASQSSPMMGGGGCGSCHGTDGRGATIRMMAATVIETPDITYDVLIEDGFTDAAIAAAIRDGVDEKGEQMDAEMPRWEMSDADMDATIAYLKELSAQ